MQTSDGKLVYLLPSKKMANLSSNLNTISQNKRLEHISKKEPPTMAVNAGSLSDPLSVTSKVVDVSDIIDNGLYSPKNVLSSDQQKINEVEALEAKLSTYQNVVEKYEKLAEDATTAAIDERKSQLRILEEQLRKREQNAKNKLANAINVIEDSQAIENTISAIVTEEIDSENERRLNMSDNNVSQGIVKNSSTLCKFKCRSSYEYYIVTHKI